MIYSQNVNTTYTLRQLFLATLADSCYVRSFSIVQAANQLWTFSASYSSSGNCSSCRSLGLLCDPSSRSIPIIQLYLSKNSAAPAYQSFHAKFF